MAALRTSTPSLLFAVGLNALYVALYPLLRPVFADDYHIASMIGVLISSFLLGIRGGIGCTIGVLVGLTVVRSRYDGTPWLETALSVDTLVGAAALLPLAVVVGGLRDGLVQLRATQEEARQTREKLEEALLAAERARLRAERSEASRGRFLANMSHEMRTPLNGVVGMTTLLLDTGLLPAQQELAETAHKSARALLAVINDILDFSKIEAGRLEIEAVEFDPREVLDEVGAILGIQAREARLELLCLCDADVPARILGDPTRFRQVLLNLVGNAVKFTPAGSVAVQLHKVSEDAQTITLLTEVRDTGIGIPAERLPTMFEAFEQSDVSTTRQFGGTGLGLAISRQLVRLMGGEIGAESRAGEGSTFWFSILAGRVADARPHSRAPGVKGLRVLVADDVDIVRRAMVTLLSRWGCQVTSAEGSEDAWQHLLAAEQRGEPFDILLCDKNMPDGSGYALGQRMLTHPTLRDLPRYILTGAPSADDDAEARAAGFRGLLAKPIHHQTLQDALAALRTPSAPVVQVPRRQGAAILLVEDNTINQLVARKYLEQQHYTVDIVENGEEALRALRTTPYALVLMDCQMPVMDGLEATRRLRDPSSRVLNSKIPVVAMTAGVMSGDREACMAAGMDDYISKPVEPAELTRALSRWIPASPA